MNTLFNIIILFIFVFVLLMLNIPQIEGDQYIKQKLYIFFGVFLFEFIVNLFIAIYKKCIINLKKIAKDSLLTALIATIGYSVYNDLVWSKSSLIPEEDNITGRKLTATIIITLFVASGYLIEALFNTAVPKLNGFINAATGSPSIAEVPQKNN